MPSRAERQRRAGERRLLRSVGCWALAGGVLLPLMAGCAATSQKQTSAERVPSPAMQQIANRLPGEYISIRDEDRPAQSLRIERRSSSGPEILALSLVQNDADGGNLRRYGLRLEAGSVENRLEGEFALLQAGGQARRSCPMDFHLTERGLVGETDPASCLFGEGAAAVGLLKEIAFDGRRISIGDRLVDPASGQARGDDQVIRFLPAPVYSGWLGVREGGDWRVARDFRLTTGGQIEPLDAAQMSLGVSIEVAYYRMEDDDSDTLMRLTLSDPDSGDIIAESWAEPGSRTIGVALPDLQVGLNRSD